MSVFGFVEDLADRFLPEVTEEDLKGRVWLNPEDGTLRVHDGKEWVPRFRMIPVTDTETDR